METPPTSAIGAVNLGVAAFQAGRLDEARTLFARALQLDAENELAWLWFATVATDPAEQRYCLNRARAINPETPGRRRLAQMPPGPAVAPPDLAHIDTPPLPPDLASSAAPLPSLPGIPLLRRPQVGLRGPFRTRHPRPRPVTHEPHPAPATDAPTRRPRWLPWLIGAVALAVIIAVATGRWLQPADELSGDPYLIAYAGPLSGPDANVGREQARAVELALEAVNQQGGIGGRPVDLLRFDDQGDPAVAAERAAAITANDDILVVIGHRRSAESLAAAPIYEAAGLAAISPSSTADALTANDPWYFRTVLPNQDQGTLVAAYSRYALGHQRASIISAPGTYEASLADAFAAEFGREGTLVERWQIDPEDRAGSITRIVDELMATDEPGIVFLPLSSAEAREVLLVLRRAGSTVPVVGGDALGYQAFGQAFADEPEELVRPGYFTNGLYAVSPFMYDSLGGDALIFAQEFKRAYGVTPEWYGARAHDAATLAVHAIGALEQVAEAPGSVAARRQLVRDTLAANDRLETAIPGLGGPLYFDATHSVPQMLSFGVFDRGVLLNAPLQYRPVTDPGKFDLAADEAAGRLMEVDGLTFRQYRVVYIGVDVNEISNLDARAETFEADFYLWFRYQGDQRAENVLFTNAVDPEYELTEPLDRAEDDNSHFAIFRVDTTFFEPLDFRDYPWDQHLLGIGLQNQTLSNDDIVYVPDPANQRQSQASRALSAVDTARPFNRIPSWEVRNVEFLQGNALARSTTPDPRTGAPEYDRFSTYRVNMEYARVVRPFLIKNLLPLALLALVTYISLYFSPENASTRIGFSVTSILTTSVLLQSISGNLPEIGYTVAIEWGYYTYIALSAMLVLINILIDRWYKRKRYVAVRRLDLFARILYPTVILIVITLYVLRFA